jgi:hypothetical protein
LSAQNNGKRYPDRSLAVQISEPLERVLIIGDLKDLTPEQRVEYARNMGRSLGFNMLTRPFDYILFREFDGGPERLELYLNARGAAQLRKIHRISIVPGSLKRVIHEEHCMVSVDVRDGWGTTDSATGSLTLYKFKNKEKVPLVGREWDNAIMKCETKAKRRATLSICGLAMLDDSQLDTMQVIGGVTPEGRIFKYPELEENVGAPTGSHEAAQAIAAKQLEAAAASPDPKIAAIAKKALEPKKIVWIKTMPDHDIAVSGYLPDFTQFLNDVAAVRFQSKKDGGVYWRFSPQYLEGFKALAGQLGVEVQ